MKIYIDDDSMGVKNLIGSFEHKKQQPPLDSAWKGGGGAETTTTTTTNARQSRPLDTGTHHPLQQQQQEQQQQQQVQQQMMIDEVPHSPIRGVEDLRHYADERVWQAVLNSPTTQQHESQGTFESQETFEYDKEENDKFDDDVESQVLSIMQELQLDGSTNHSDSCNKGDNDKAEADPLNLGTFLKKKANPLPLIAASSSSSRGGGGSSQQKNNHARSVTNRSTASASISLGSAVRGPPRKGQPGSSDERHGSFNSSDNTPGLSVEVFATPDGGTTTTTTTTTTKTVSSCDSISISTPHQPAAVTPSRGDCGHRRLIRDDCGNSIDPSFFDSRTCQTFPPPGYSTSNSNLNVCPEALKKFTNKSAHQLRALLGQATDLQQWNNNSRGNLDGGDDDDNEQSERPSSSIGNNVCRWGGGRAGVDPEGAVMSGSSHMYDARQIPPTERAGRRGSRGGGSSMRRVVRTRSRSAERFGRLADDDDPRGVLNRRSSRNRLIIPMRTKSNEWGHNSWSTGFPDLDSTVSFNKGRPGTTTTTTSAAVAKTSIAPSVQKISYHASVPNLSYDPYEDDPHLEEDDAFAKTDKSWWDESSHHPPPSVGTGDPVSAGTLGGGDAFPKTFTAVQREKQAIPLGSTSSHSNNSSEKNTNRDEFLSPSTKRRNNNSNSIDLCNFLERKEQEFEYPEELINDPQKPDFGIDFEPDLSTVHDDGLVSRDTSGASPKTCSTESITPSLALTTTTKQVANTAAANRARNNAMLGSASNHTKTKRAIAKFEAAKTGPNTSTNNGSSGTGISKQQFNKSYSGGFGTYGAGTGLSSSSAHEKRANNNKSFSSGLNRSKHDSVSSGGSGSRHTAKNCSIATKASQQMLKKSEFKSEIHAVDDENDKKQSFHLVEEEDDGENQHQQNRKNQGNYVQNKKGDTARNEVKADIQKMEDEVRELQDKLRKMGPDRTHVLSSSSPISLDDNDGMSLLSIPMPTVSPPPPPPLTPSRTSDTDYNASSDTMVIGNKSTSNMNTTITTTAATTDDAVDTIAMTSRSEHGDSSASSTRDLHASMSSMGVNSVAGNKKMVKKKRIKVTRTKSGNIVLDEKTSKLVDQAKVREAVMKFQNQNRQHNQMHDSSATFVISVAPSTSGPYVNQMNQSATSFAADSTGGGSAPAGPVKKVKKKIIRTKSGPAGVNAGGTNAPGTGENPQSSDDGCKPRPRGRSLGPSSADGRARSVSKARPKSKGPEKSAEGRARSKSRPRVSDASNPSQVTNDQTNATRVESDGRPGMKRGSSVKSRTGMMAKQKSSKSIKSQSAEAEGAVDTRTTGAVKPKPVKKIRSKSAGPAPGSPESRGRSKSLVRRLPPAPDSDVNTNHKVGDQAPPSPGSPSAKSRGRSVTSKGRPSAKSDPNQRQRGRSIGRKSGENKSPTSANGKPRVRAKSAGPGAVVAASSEPPDRSSASKGKASDAGAKPGRGRPLASRPAEAGAMESCPNPPKAPARSKSLGRSAAPEKTDAEQSSRPARTRGRSVGRRVSAETNTSSTEPSTPPSQPKRGSVVGEFFKGFKNVVTKTPKSPSKKAVDVSVGKPPLDSLSGRESDTQPHRSSIMGSSGGILRNKAAASSAQTPRKPVRRPTNDTGHDITISRTGIRQAAGIGNPPCGLIRTPSQRRGSMESTLESTADVPVTIDIPPPSAASSVVPSIMQQSTTAVAPSVSSIFQPQPISPITCASPIKSPRGKHKRQISDVSDDALFRRIKQAGVTEDMLEKLLASGLVITEGGAGL